MKIDDDWRYHHFRKPPHLHVSSKIRVSAASQPLISCVDSNFWKTKFKLSQRNASSFLNLLKNPCIYVVTFLISGWKHHGQIPFLLLWHTHIYIYIAKNYTTWRIPHDLQWNHQIFKFLNMWKNHKFDGWKPHFLVKKKQLSPVFPGFPMVFCLVVSSASSVSMRPGSAVCSTFKTTTEKDENEYKVVPHS